MLIGRRNFDTVSVIDFEFVAAPGETPAPHTLVVQDAVSGRTQRFFGAELLSLKGPPYPAGADDLVVGYFTAAEMACHLALGWKIPAKILDLYAEFRIATNGRALKGRQSLSGAMEFFGLGSIDLIEKDAMRRLAMRGGPYSDAEAAKLMDYCQHDVEATVKLLAFMASKIDIDRALLRGRYTGAVARMEAVGVPIDVDAFRLLHQHRESIIRRVIEELDPGGIYEAGAFRQQRFADWLVERRIPWPRLASGALDLKEKTFDAQADRFPEVAPLRRLRNTLTHLRQDGLAVGRDGYSRCMLSPFSSKTGRNQPSTARFIFGQPSWLRGLVRPPAGRGLAYIDFEQQEFAVAAYLSQDEAMIAAYETGDPYLAFGKQAGVIPLGATKETHGPERELFKRCALGVLFGMGMTTLAERIGKPPAHAAELLRLHRATYCNFWRWSDAVVDHAMCMGTLAASFGWPFRVGADTIVPQLRNFPMQANGAEMLRIACIMATEDGIRVCAPVHDALLIEAPADRLEEHVARTRAAMAAASRMVLKRGAVRTDARLVYHPDTLLEAKGEAMWRLVFDSIPVLPGRDSDSAKPE